MKKYKQKTPLFSPKIIMVAALIAMAVTLLLGAFTGFDNVWHILCGEVALVIIIADLIIFLGAGGNYRYSDKCIEVFYLFVLYRKLKYSRYSAIVISNAIYNNGYGYLGGDISMQYKTKDHRKVDYPFITLHTADYPIHKIKSGMNSRELFMLRDDEIYCLGICWFDSLRELLTHTNCPVYILKDVYLRNQEQFDSVVSEYNSASERFVIIH